MEKVEPEGEAGVENEDKDEGSQTPAGLDNDTIFDSLYPCYEKESKYHFGSAQRRPGIANWTSAKIVSLCKLASISVDFQKKEKKRVCFILHYHLHIIENTGI